jgi:hypothetical protein
MSDFDKFFEKYITNNDDYYCFKCKKCNYETNEKHNLIRHFGTYKHINREQYKFINNHFCCDFCNYKSNRLNNYETHLKSKKHSNNVYLTGKVFLELDLDEIK